MITSVVRRWLTAVFGGALFVVTPGCMHKVSRSAATASTPVPDSSYLDLAPGGHLRILVPIVRSGSFEVAAGSVETDGRTIVLSAANLVGYEVSHYSVEGRANGRVRLRFETAEITREGKASSEKNAPRLPFAWPAKPQHLRLLYLVRNSRADHSMAIAGAKNLEALNRFTAEFKGRPEICRAETAIFCTWVPAGIAITSE